MYSYNIEQASGHGGHNIVTVIMNEKGVDLDGALNWLAEYHEQVLSNFQAQYRGIDCWSLEAERYFGTKGLEVKEHRRVTLLPKVKKPDVTPMMAQPLAQPDA